MNHYMTKTMVDRLYSYMRKANVSTQHICNVLNVSYPDFISAINGKHPFYNKWQRKIAEALGVDREELFREFVAPQI